MGNLDKLVIIAGATATGKSNAAIQLAKLINGEIISADSMQIYRKMNIGTAKLTQEEMKGIPHHLIDELEPDEPYSVAQFQKLAKERITQIHNRNHMPIICGGTGFYINALIFGATFDNTPKDDAYRGELSEIAQKQGAEAIFDMLLKIDPQTDVNPKNIKRVIRALEFYKQTGRRFSEHNEEMRHRPMIYDCKIVILEAERGILYERINQRVDEMINTGLVDEVRSLLDAGYSPKLISMQGLGYKEIAAHFEGLCSLEDAVDAIKQGTRRFAKRQITWFRNQLENEDVFWLDIAQYASSQDLANEIFCLL